MNTKKISSVLFLALFVCQFQPLLKASDNAIANLFSWCVQRPKTVVAAIATAGIVVQEICARRSMAPTKINNEKIITHTFDEPLPEDMKNALDEYFKKDSTILKTISAQQVQLLPILDQKWIIKFNMTKIYGAKVFAQAINELGYANFALPKKYLYTTENGLKYVIVERIEPSNLRVSFSETQQIKELAKKIKWTDVWGANFIKAVDGRIFFIDTEPRFSPGFCNDKLLKYVNDGLSCVVQNSLTWPAWLYCQSSNIMYGLKNLFTHSFTTCGMCQK